MHRAARKQLFMTSDSINKKLLELYTPLSAIKDELRRRGEDTVLQEKVASLFSEYPLNVFEGAPKAVLSRSIMTPNKEFQYYTDVVDNMGLEKMLFEYDGKFVAKNSEKYHLCRLCFVDPDTQQSATYKIVNFNEWQGKKMHSILTTSGKNLLDIHRSLLESEYPHASKDVIDITNWFNAVRSSDEGYYFYYLSLFMTNCVLFENFLINEKDEREFFETKVYPSLQKVVEFFGVKPLIVPLLPISNEGNDAWLYYDARLKNLL